VVVTQLVDTTGVFDPTHLECPQAAVCTHWLQDCVGFVLVVLLMVDTL
jgi:hypothetical protein